MSRKEPRGNAAEKDDSRKDRLRAALKANLARRKAQTRARAKKADERPETTGDEG